MTDISRHLQVEHTPEKTVVSITGEPAPEQFAELVDRVYEIARQHSGDVKLDVGAIDFIPSTSLGALVALDKKIGALGRQLVLARPSESLGELLEITGLEDVFQVEKT